MSKQREALKLALEAMDCIYSPLHVREINKVGAAMVAIREALAEQEQQPLTEPELNAIEPTWPNEWNYDDVLVFVRAIERAHGIGVKHE